MPPTATRPRLLPTLLLAAGVLLAGCERAGSRPRDARVDAVADSLADAPSPPFRNVSATQPVAYVGDSSCAGCHASEARAYHQRSMSQSLHRWTPATRTESTLVAPIVHPRSGFRYTVVQEGDRLWQVESLVGPEGQRLHELRRRMDWVVGSGRVARTYFSEENGHLAQLPLTWYHSHGWDFSPGYELTNLRFDRALPDRCVACHSSYPRGQPYLEGKYADLRPGIGCERCHGPGALHVAERRSGAKPQGAYDASIVNPARLPVERRLDVCEQCHVHAAVELPREGRGAFDFVPSQRLSDYYAFYKKAGDIDVVSHADRLRQSACFLATRRSTKPLECATCHDPHQPAASGLARSQPCMSCHTPVAIATKFAGKPAAASHAPGADCVSCHMPNIRERTVPHGTFTEHWIRVPGREAEGGRASTAGAPIEAYYRRDRVGPDAIVYRAMGEVVHANLTNDRRALVAAADSLDRALGADTTRGDALFLLGVAWQQLGDTARAVEALGRALRVDPRRPETLRALAQAHIMAGRPAAAESLYVRALTAQPALAWIRAEYADLLQAQGVPARAAAQYRAAVAEQPDLATAWFNLGTTLSAGADAAAGVSAFRQAVHLDPSLGEALSWLVRIEVRGDSVAAVQGLESPVTSLPARDRGPRAVRLSVGRDVDRQGVTFVNVPAFGVVQVIRPDGTVLRTLSNADGQAVNWDFRSDAGRLVGGGLYRVRVLGRDASGRALPARTLAFGIVRGHA